MDSEGSANDNMNGNVVSACFQPTLGPQRTVTTISAAAAGSLRDAPSSLVEICSPPLQELRPMDSEGSTNEHKNGNTVPAQALDGIPLPKSVGKVASGEAAPVEPCSSSTVSSRGDICIPPLLESRPRDSGGSTNVVSLCVSLVAGVVRWASSVAYMFVLFLSPGLVQSTSVKLFKRSRFPSSKSASAAFVLILLLILVTLSLAGFYPVWGRDTAMATGGNPQDDAGQSMDVTPTIATTQQDTGYGFRGNQGEKQGRLLPTGEDLDRKVNALTLVSKNGNWPVALRKGAGQPHYVDNEFYQRWQEAHSGNIDVEDRLGRAVSIWNANQIDPTGDQVPTPPLPELRILLRDVKGS